MSALVLFEAGNWLHVDAAGLNERGTDGQLVPGDYDMIVGVVPGRDATVQGVTLLGLSDPQAAAAARLALGEASIVPANALHVAVGPADDRGNRVAAAVASERIAALLADWAGRGFDPDLVIPASLLLAAPDDGFVSATFLDETVVRGRDRAWADDPLLTPLLTGGSTPVAFDAAAADAILATALIDPAVNLRTGAFAKRRPLTIEVARLRRAAVLLLALGLVILAAQLAAIVRINAVAAGIEARTQAQAAKLLPTGTLATDPVVQVQARLAEMQGAGGGFGPLATAVATAVSATPGSSISGLVFDGAGGLRVTVHGNSVADLGAVEARLTATRLIVAASPVVAASRPYHDITVTAP